MDPQRSNQVKSDANPPPAAAPGGSNEKVPQDGNSFSHSTPKQGESGNLTKLTNPRPDVTELTSQFSAVKLASNSGLTTNDEDFKQISKKALPFNAQTFLERPSATMENSGLVPTFEVETNFFRVEFEKEVLLYQYHVEYMNQKNLKMKKEEFTRKAFWYAHKQLADANSNIFPAKTHLIYDGVGMLWSTQKLNIDDRVTIDFSCKDPKVYRMTITVARIIKLIPHPENETDRCTLIAVLDEVLTSRMTCLYENDSRWFHKQKNSMFFIGQEQFRQTIELGAGLEACIGLHGAIKPNLQAGLLLNVDLGCSVFYKTDFNLAHFYVEILGNVPFSERLLNEIGNRGMDMDQRRKLEAALKGKSLIYRSPVGRTKTFTFISISTKAASAITFQNKETNLTMSVTDYFESLKYKLRCPNLPCVCMHKQKNIWIPMELVYTSSVVSKVKGRISEKQMRTLVKETAFPPLKRREILMNMAAVTDDNRVPKYLAEQDEYMKEVSLSVDRRLIKVTASLLPAPTLEFGEDIKIRDDDNTGSWTLKNGETLKKIKSGKLTIIPAVVFVTPDSKKQKYTTGIRPLKTLMECLHNFGVTCPGGGDAFNVEKFDPQEQSWNIITNWMTEFKETVKQEWPGAVPLTLFVFPYKCSTRRQIGGDRYTSEYGIIKRICDVVVGVYSQGILTQTFEKMRGNAVTNSTVQYVAIKILGKVGATLYTLGTNPVDNSWAVVTDPTSPTLFLGVDVTHPGHQDLIDGGYAANSVACIVGNVDLECMQFEASARPQVVNEERTLNMRFEVLKRIDAFLDNTGLRPAHIVLYRDGVSESQFKETLYEEKKSILDAIQEIGGGYCPTLTYIMVTKRHHTRFFPLNKNDTYGPSNNLKSGTLVETTVTSHSLYDFYLYSHSGPLGTSRPSHFYVLHDDWAPTPTFWQNVTHYLSFGYCRCPKAVSLPSPVAYAHLGAKRAKEYLLATAAMNEAKLSKQSEYENFETFKKYMQRHKDLQGMVFV